MLARFCLLVLAAALLGLGSLSRAQDAPPPPLPVPEGIEVQARGPIHEAFAGPTAEAAPTTAIDKKPPAMIDELPPAEKPSGNVIWISGYWAYDEDHKDHLWVSGVWRTPPANKQWIAGYWREQGTQWQWVPGFWSKAAKQEEQQVTYLPPPPAAPAIAPPGTPPTPGSFFVPGCWVWTGSAYAWRAGYWTRVQPNYVWVPNHYRWTPSGYIFIDGYWDYALKDRGLLYAPVIIRPRMLTVGFTYTPAYAVRDTVVVDAFFVRPSTCHYYFGDYYGPAYESRGYQSCVVYSRRHYDSIVVYECYERRSQPNWINIQVNLYNDRCHGRAFCPPRTLVAQQQFVRSNTYNKTVNNTTINNTTVVNNITMIAPPNQVASAKSASLVKVDNATRQQARMQAVAVQQVSHQRVASEKPLPPGAPRQARVASLSVPQAQPVRPGMVAPKPARVAPPSVASTARPVQPGTTGHPAANATSGSQTPGLRPATAAPSQPAPKTPIQQPPAGHSGTAAVTPGVQPGVTGQPVSRTPPGTTGQPATQLKPGQPGYRPPVKGNPVRRPPPKRPTPEKQRP